MCARGVCTMHHKWVHRHSCNYNIDGWRTCSGGRGTRPGGQGNHPEGRGTCKVGQGTLKTGNSEISWGGDFWKTGNCHMLIKTNFHSWIDHVCAWEPKCPSLIIIYLCTKFNNLVLNRKRNIITCINIRWTSQEIFLLKVENSTAAAIPDPDCMNSCIYSRFNTTKQYCFQEGNVYIFNIYK